MDTTKFDGISRLFASATSRRGALAILAGAFGIGASALELEEIEAGNKRRRSRKQKVAKKKGKGTPPCRGEGHPCVGEGNVCCPGLVCGDPPNPGADRRCVKKEPPKECKGKCSEKDPCPDLKDCECVFHDAGATTEVREGRCETKKPPVICKDIRCKEDKDCSEGGRDCVCDEKTYYCKTQSECPKACECGCEDYSNECRPVPKCPDTCTCGCEKCSETCLPEVKCSDECHCGCDPCTGKCNECKCPADPCDPKDIYATTCGEHCVCVPDPYDTYAPGTCKLAVT